MPHVKAGKLHLVCVNHTARMVDFPDVPTLTELGFPGYDVLLWFCLWAPGGTPNEIINKLNAKLNEISSTDDMKAKLQLAGAVPVVQLIDGSLGQGSSLMQEKDACSRLRANTVVDAGRRQQKIVGALLVSLVVVD